MSALSMTPARSRSMLLRLLAAAVGIAAIVAVTIAVWPASAAEKARADGENLGEAVGALYYADTTEEVDAALTDISSALQDTRDHAGDEISSQVNDQVDAMDRAVDGFVGSHTADNDWDQDLYQSELDYAVDDLVDNADDWANQRSDVKQAYAEGFQDGLPAELQS